MYSADNIFTGTATLYVDGQEVGWTQGGVRLRTNKSLWYRPSWYGVGVDEVVKQDESFYVSTVLVEHTIVNLKRALGLAGAITNPNDNSDYIRIDIGGSLTIPEHTLRFVTRDNSLQAIFYRAVAIDFGELTYSRGIPLLPITFRLLIDTTKDVGEQIGYIIQGPYYGFNTLYSQVTVPKIKRIQVYSRVTVLNESSNNFTCQVTVPKIKRNQLYMRLTVPQLGTSTIWSYATVLKAATENLVSRVTVVYAAGSLDLRCRVTVPKYGTSTLWSKVTVVYIDSALNLVCRATVRQQSTNSLVSRVTVLKEGTSNLVSRATVTYATGTQDLQCQVTVTS